MYKIYGDSFPDFVYFIFHTDPLLVQQLNFLSSFLQNGDWRC